MRGSETAEKALLAARLLIQTRGYNGFSFADVAAAVGVAKPTLHHHFATKEDLGRTLAIRYREDFMAGRCAEHLDSIIPEQELRRIIEEFALALDGGSGMCLCGMLAADVDTVGESVRLEVRRFFDELEAWVAKVMEHGDRTGTLRIDYPAEAVARDFVSTLEGAALIAHAYGDSNRFLESANRTIERLIT